MPTHDPYLEPYILKLIPGRVGKVLDVGCGYGSWGYMLKVEKDMNAVFVGVDLWKPYLIKLKQLGIYEDLILADANHLPFKEKSFDLGLAIEVLEHLDKKKGILFLVEIERTSNKAIITTPWGFTYQGIVHNNPFQKHISTWYPKDFALRGYKTCIISPFPRTLMIIDMFRRLIIKLALGKPRLAIRKGTIIAVKNRSLT